MIMHLALTPDYGNAGLLGTVGNADPTDRRYCGSLDCYGKGLVRFSSDGSLSQVSFGSDSTVWAVDGGGHRVHHFNQSGELIKTIGRGTAGIGPGELRLPHGIAVSHLSSSIFIGEYMNSRISEFNQSDGAFVRVLDTPGLKRPYRICLSPDETTLAVACADTNCIKVIRVDGSQAPRTIGEEKPDPTYGILSRIDGEFRSPGGVCFTRDGQQLVVADCGNDRIQVLSLAGSFVSKIQLYSSANAARDVAVDVVGNIVVIGGPHPPPTIPYSEIDVVKVFSPEGTLLHDKLGGLEMEDCYIAGLAIDPSSGRIAVGENPSTQWQYDEEQGGFVGHNVPGRLHLLRL